MGSGMSRMQTRATSTNGHRRTRSSPCAGHRKDVHQDAVVTPSSPSEATFKEPLPFCVGSCLSCGTFPDNRLVSPVSTSKPPSYSSEDPYSNGPSLDTEVLNAVDLAIDGLNADLRQLSLDIWERPEIGYEEHYAHNRLTAFMESHGFKVTRKYLGMQTAWRAEFSCGEGGRVIGLQSEMDALPNIGHACGHNLIAISGVAVAIGLKAALQKHAVSGKIVLLGTPAEEHGGGKIQLLSKGAYEDMSVCLMAHPGPGTPNSTIIPPWTAVQNIEVQYTGRGAHAGYSPWEAQNALDAAFLAYSGVSVLRQQIKPSHRVTGIISGQDWQTNIIPDSSKMIWAIRAPTWAELEDLRDRVINCLQAAAIATSCQHDIVVGTGYKDCKENGALAKEYARVAEGRYGLSAVVTTEVIQASTDAGDVSYEIPTIEPVFAIPTEQNGSNHTPMFAQSARSMEAHAATIAISKCLAATALRVLSDDAFFQQIRDTFEEQLRR